MMFNHCFSTFTGESEIYHKSVNHSISLRRASVKSVIANRMILATVLFVGFAASADAGSMILYIGDYSSQQILRYDATNITTPIAINGPSNPWASGITAEGIACIMGVPGPTSNIVYVANNATGTIETLNADANTNPVLKPNFITGLNSPTGIALSPDGHYLYVTQFGSSTITRYDAITGVAGPSVSFAGAHDLAIRAITRRRDIRCTRQPARITRVW